MQTDGTMHDGERRAEEGTGTEDLSLRPLPARYGLVISSVFLVAATLGSAEGEAWAAPDGTEQTYLPSRSVSVTPSPEMLLEQLQGAFHRLQAQQVSLPPRAAQILYGELEDLYA